ncbi:MAG: adenylate/guanylate cyclase domain-containing protein [Candidatus Wallbacteria bacterium]|nr:adenylate/guanylate cyclase domain-containing protein [Candidatus Wallbacteria bacterium]
MLITDKRLTGLRTHIVLFPFMMSCFQMLYTDLYLLTAATGFMGLKISEKSDFELFFSYGQNIEYNPFATLLMFYAVLIYFWSKPIMRFTRKPDDSEARRMTAEKLDNANKSLILLFSVVFIFRIAEHLTVFHKIIDWNQFFICHLPAIALSVFTQAALALVYYGCIIYQSQNLLAMLREKEEYYTVRPGFALSTWKKISMILVTNGILPLAAVYALMVIGEAAGTKVFNTVVVEAIFQMIIVNVVAMSFVFHGLWRPVDELIGKMKLVAEGDFDVRLPIYMNDDMSLLKLHFNRMAAGLKERENVKDMFGKYLSIEVAKKLLEDKDVNLGGDEICGAVLFCDIRNFTSMSESMTPQQVVEFLNRYFSYVTEPILQEKGVINKFIGDAVMAIFSPVFGLQDYADAALRSALGMHRKLEDFNREFPQYRTEFGIGIHAGPLVAGNIGTEKRLEYTVIGDTVNAASRLETETKNQNLPILVSSQFCSKLTGDGKKRYNLRRVASVHVKGRVEELELFTPELSPKTL